jgi:uncharacterized membrane protein YfcA
VAASQNPRVSDETFAAVVAVSIVGCQWWIMDELRVPAKWAMPALATVLVGALLFLWLLPRRKKHAPERLRFGLASVLVVANLVNLLRPSSMRLQARSSCCSPESSYGP